MSAAADVVVRRARPDERDRLLDLKCAVWPHLVRSNELARWTWQFDLNPAYDHDNPTTLVLDDGGVVVGLFTLIPHRVQLGGRVGLACDGVDFCVADSHRGTGLSPLMVRRWMSTESCQFAFTTTPSDVAVHVFETCGGRLLGQDGEPMAWSWFPRGENPPLPIAPTRLAVEAVASLGPEADALWAAVAERQSLALVKDAAYLNWRYARFPFEHAELLATTESGGALRGVSAVQRDRQNNRMFLCDFVVVPGDDAATDASLHAAVERARQADVEALYVATREPAFIARLIAFGFRAVPGPYPRLLGKLNDGGPGRVTLDAWTTALGDGDQLYNLGEPLP